MYVGMYYNNHDVRVEETPKPKIGPGELLFKVRACGICGSDVMEWYRLKRAPLVLGHEATGEIVEVGKEVKGCKVGDRIFASHHVPCNSCRYCLNGQHTACETLHTTNYYPGGFSEYVRLPKINVERGVFILPEDLSFEEGIFTEPLACVVRAQRAVGLRPGQSVFILGGGISGLLHLLLARALGAEKILVTDVNPMRLELAKKLGADAAFNAKDDILPLLRKANRDRLADLVVVSTSALSAFLQSLQLVDRAGTILCFAPTEPGVNLEIPVNEFWRKNIKIIHSYGANPDDLSAAIELLRDKKIAVKSLISHRLRLSEIGLGFKLTAEAKDALKVIIEFDR